MPAEAEPGAGMLLGGTVSPHPACGCGAEMQAAPPKVTSSSTAVPVGRLRWPACRLRSVERYDPFSNTWASGPASRGSKLSR